MNEEDLAPDVLLPGRFDPPADLQERRSEDFKFMVLCEYKRNMGMYQLMRDKELDKWKHIK